MAILSGPRRARAADAIARSLLDAAMALAAMALDWALRRRSHRG
jgi:hypothetical protein